MVEVIRKKGFLYFIDFYKIINFLFFAACLFFTKMLALFFLHERAENIGLSNILYKLYSVTLTVLFVAVWILVFWYNSTNKTYFFRTGRNLRYDSTHFRRSIKELTEYFRDADTRRLDVDALPEISWQDASGLVFGKSNNRLIGYRPKKNGICTFVWGAPGDGKTTSVIIPSCRQFGLFRNKDGNLIQRGSVMVTDLKGDIYEANKKYRRIKRFSTVHWQESAHYDPLYNSRSMKKENRAIFLENLAFTIIPNEQSADAKYFVDGARDFFTGITLYLLNKDNEISFPCIIEQIVVGNFADWVIEIKNSDDTLAKSYTNHFYGENEKNVSGIYSKLVSCTRLFSTEIMKKLLVNDEDSISPANLEHGIDIYIQVDPNQIALMAPVIAMLYQDFMSAMLYRSEGQQPPIAFVLDEFGQLPAMPVIEQSAALLRAYNCSLMLCCQSLSMLDKRYGIEGRKLLLDCAKVHCFLSIMDPDTRDWASRLFGSRKVLKISNNENDTSSGRTVSEAKENVFDPEEFGDLPNNDELLIYCFGKYIRAEKTYYFLDN